MFVINCYLCGNKTNKNRVALANRMIVCGQCFQKHVFVCKFCKFKYIDSDYNTQLQCCNYCASGIENQKKNKKLRIHNYYFKPYPTFFKKNNDNQLFLGVQLQIGGVKQPQTVNHFAANNENDFFYIKKDSTIPQYGCQVVCYPATLNYHFSIKNKWKKMLCSSRENHFKSYNIQGCGLHIHVNKNFFNKEEIKKLDIFINNNQQFITDISRRKSDYAHFLVKPLELYGKPINQNRHCALNLTNENTIEFRTFKGTINYNSLMSYLQFVYNVCYFIKNCNSDQLKYIDFLKYLKKQKSKFLKTFLKKRIKNGKYTTAQ